MRLILILFFLPHSLAAQVLTTSNLPIIVIQTNGQPIVDNPSIEADMGIVDNGPGNTNNVAGPYNNYNGRINIQIRGSSSQSFPKKGYSVETINMQGKSINVPLLGMPAENDWVLHGPYSDKALMRNYLTYSWANKLGSYAPRVRFCEVVINNDYRGLYVLTEKVKRDTGRVYISKLKYTDTTGNAITGGYILKIDKTTGNSSPGWLSTHNPPNAIWQKVKFQHHYPQEYEMHPAQIKYIRNYVDSFEVALKSPNFDHPVNGWKKYGEWGSFINFFLINEITRNVDGYRLSTFFYKNKPNHYGKGRLFMGPVWDFNIALGNANYCQGGNTTGWAYNFNYVCNTDGYLVPFWWQKLMTDTAFVNELRCHWNYRRQGMWHNDSITAYIDSLAAYIDDAQQRNFQRWPVLGTYVWPNNYVGNTYTQELQYLKNWLLNRAAWIDANLPGTCHWVTSVPEKPAPNHIHFQVFPNPCVDDVFIELADEIQGTVMISLFDVSGKLYRMETIHTASGQDFVAWNMQDLPKGMYVLRVQTEQEVFTRKLVKQ